MALAGLVLAMGYQEGAAGSRPLAMLLPLLAYMAPLYNPPRANLVGLATPLVLMGVIFCLFRQQHDAAPGGANPD